MTIYKVFLPFFFLFFFWKYFLSSSPPSSSVTIIIIQRNCAINKFTHVSAAAAVASASERGPGSSVPGRWSQQEELECRELMERNASKKYSCNFTSKPPSSFIPLRVLFFIHFFSSEFDFRKVLLSVSLLKKHYILSRFFSNTCTVSREMFPSSHLEGSRTTFDFGISVGFSLEGWTQRGVPPPA